MGNHNKGLVENMLSGFHYHCAYMVLNLSELDLFTTGYVDGKYLHNYMCNVVFVLMSKVKHVVFCKWSTKSRF
uniref:Uncharacterized protein n=1 Tax=Rhizophora mucronata TaxID=61149 RepID=A0A2P2QMN8_RHIMU